MNLSSSMDSMGVSSASVRRRWGDGGGGEQIGGVGARSADGHGQSQPPRTAHSADERPGHRAVRVIVEVGEDWSPCGLIGRATQLRVQVGGHLGDVQFLDVDVGGGGGRGAYADQLLVAV